MIILKIIHTFVWWVILVFLYITITSIILPFSFFMKKPHLIFLLAARYWARLALFFAGIKVKTKGLENLPKSGPLIVASNHQSLMDIFIMLAWVPFFFRFVVKKELFKIPLMGWYMKRAGYLPIDRQAAMKAHQTLETAKMLLEQGEVVLIFPEGTRSPDGNLQDFKRGSFMVALETGTPILPTAINGSFKIVAKGGFLIHPETVTLSFGELVYPQKIEEPSKKDCEELNELVRKRIEELINRRAA